MPRPHFRLHDRHTFLVTRLAESDGSRAIADHQEVRLPGGVPGDIGTLTITHAGQHAAWARIDTLEQPSADRVAPPCPVVDQCGGCPWQMVSQPAQRAAKMANLRALLEPVAADATWHDWPGAADVTTGYRTRALMMARRRPNSPLNLGFFAPGSIDLVPVSACAVQHPLVNQVLDAARNVLDRHNLSCWRDAHHPGQVRAVLFRLDPDVGEGLLTLVVTYTAGLEAVAQDLLQLPGVTGVSVNVNNAVGGQVMGPTTVHMAGEQRQIVRWGALELAVGPTAFLQTRHDMAQHMITTAAGLLPQHMTRLVDLYAGVGLFGLALRDRADAVTLVERDVAGVEDARWNIERLQAGHVTAEQADVLDFAPKLAELQPDAVVLDPPRAGCAPAVADAVAALPGEPVLIYVSCHPPALARDVKRLHEGGFRVTDVVPLDMFPHTAHVEVMVRLARV